ncbi:MAG: tRNA (N6-threonylcarbamoyladenosine(37)-N6)-methyltransferase TrmO [Clostridia bacterium]|nr:tRNA (N6-threonylcarbamoyladenosine(37)-N6)-methyltransferase TrmO [Clostridia bacterium]
MAIIEPIAHIKTDFKEKFGIPRQSGKASTAKGIIIFTEKYRNDDALKGIEEYSHLWLIFDFSAAHTKDWSPTVRPPRLGGNKRVGVFATRSPFRPNSIGLSSVRLEEIKKDSKNGSVIIVSGVDLLDGTPIYDIKPYIPYSDCHIDAKGGFADKYADYKLDVVFLDDTDKLLPNETKITLIECLGDDPRPSYKDDGDRVYKMNFADYEIGFKVDNNTLFVISVEKTK